MSQIYDLAIVGGGPAGLSAAINGASEGLAVLLIDAEPQLGGQARESAAIENYPGFPDGITGDHLMTALTRQADKFETVLQLPSRITHIQQDIDALSLFDEFGQLVQAKTVLLSLGLTYRRLEAVGLNKFLGHGAYYGLPVGRVPASDCDVVVIGGANSSGQAVLHIARNKRAKIRLVSRSPLTKGMSQYLIDRIRATPNIEVLEDCTVSGCVGQHDGKLHSVEIVWHGVQQVLPCDHLFMFIGAQPKTFWLDGAVQRDERGFVRTWQDVEQGPASILPFETSMPGVFAAGDVRANSIKRIAAAVGEGSAALQMIHRRLG